MLKFSLQQLQIGFSERAEGSFRDPEKIRAFLASNFLENEALVHLHLVNQAQVMVFGPAELAELSKQPSQLQVLTGDALMSNFSPSELKAKSVAFSMVVGDCFPLLFFDQKSQNMAMVHAGRGPLSLGVLQEVWQKMLSLWQTEPQQLWALLGPGIRRESYLIPTEPVQLADQKWQKFIERTTRADRSMWRIDLPGLIKDFLQTAGLPAEHLIDSGFDTYALPDQFCSHRRSQELNALGQVQQAQAEDGRFIVACRLGDPKGD